MEVLANTDIAGMLAEILAFDHSADELIYFMKLEALWILTNLCYGSKQDVMTVLDCSGSDGGLLARLD